MLSAIVRVMVRTGRSVRPTAHQVMAATMATRIGRPKRSKRVIAAGVLGPFEGLAGVDHDWTSRGGGVHRDESHVL